MIFLGIDIGTTGSKIISFDTGGNILASSYREYSLICNHSGWAELDPEDLYTKICDGIREVSHKINKNQVKAICFSSQGAGPVPIDKDGNALYNCITALDVRSIKQINHLQNSVGREKIYKITGMPLHPLYSLNQIMWLMENIPDIHRNVSTYTNLVGYILSKWGIATVMDKCLACSSMALDINKGEWAEEMLSAAGVELSMFPALIKPGTKIGELSSHISKYLDLPEGTSIIAGGHDQACAALGAGVMHSGTALDSTGTVEAIVPVWNKPILTDKLLNAAVFWDIHVVPDKYIGIAANFSAGSVLRWYRDTYYRHLFSEAEKKGIDIYELILPDYDWEPSEIFVLPHFSGSFSPWCDPLSKGAIIGLGLETKDKDIAKAIIDCVTYEARLIVDGFENSGTDIKELRATGGATKQKKWLQLKADIIGKPIAVPDVTEASCLGAALLAAWGTETFSSLEEGVKSWVRVQETYYPRPEQHKRFTEKYELYKELYPILKNFNHKMAKAGHE